MRIPAAHRCLTLHYDQIGSDGWKPENCDILSNFSESRLERGLERSSYEKAQETEKFLLNYSDSPEKGAICTQLPLNVVQELVQKN